MAPLDWTLVAALNGVIILYGLWLARGTRSTNEWFLAAKGLPWWLVGLSLFATAVDSGDYVAVIGGAYRFGMVNLTTWWLGLPFGWFLVTFFLLVPLYRSGMFTNAEYHGSSPSSPPSLTSTSSFSGDHHAQSHTKAHPSVTVFEGARAPDATTSMTIRLPLQYTAYLRLPEAVAASTASPQR